MREARDLNIVLEGETLRLRGEIKEERKKSVAARGETKAAVSKCERALKRHEDLRVATEVRVDALNKVISDLEIKVQTLAKNELKFSSTIFELRRGGVSTWNRPSKLNILLQFEKLLLI